MIDSGKTIGLGILSIFINFILMIVKITVGVLGNSYALIADGIESAADIFTSLVTWVGFHLSLRPPDDNHPYGHGKIESLAGIFSGSCLLLAAIVIAYNAIREILVPHHSPEWFTLPVLLGVVVVKEYLSRRILKEGTRLESRALEGDAWHHRSDALTSFAVAIGISVALIGGPKFAPADDWAALLACAIIVVNGVRIIKLSLHDVLDARVEGELLDAVRTHAHEIDGVEITEKCRIRKSGIGYFVELHVQVEGSVTVRKGHEIGHDVKSHLLASMPQLLDVVIHLEPLPHDAVLPKS